MLFTACRRISLTALGVFASLSSVLLSRAGFAETIAPLTESTVHVFSAEVAIEPLTPACPLPKIPLLGLTSEEAAGLPLIIEPVGLEQVLLTSSVNTEGNPGVQPIQINAPIAQLMNAGKLEDALAQTREIQDQPTQAAHLEVISRAYLERGQADQAEATALSIPVPSPEEIQANYGLPAARDRALLLITAHYINAGALESALAMVDRLAEPYRISKLLDIAEQYRQRGELTEAAAILDRAELIALSPSAVLDEGDLNEEGEDGSPPPEVWARWEMARYYIRTGKLESALAVVQRLDEIYQGSLLFNIAQKYRQRNQSELALPLLDRALAIYQETAAARSPLNVQPGSSPILDSALDNLFHFFTLDQYASEYMALQQPEKAAELASELFSLAQTYISLGEGTSSLSVLLRAANIYRLANQDDRANAVLAFIVQKVDGLEKPYLKAIVLAAVSRLYAGLAERDRAETILFQAQRFADRATDGSQHNLSTVALIQSFAALGQYDNASQIAGAIESVALRQAVEQAIDCARRSSGT